MQRHRLFVAPARTRCSPLVLEPDEVSYLFRVLRLQVGGTLEVFDGEGRVYEGTIERISAKEGVVRLGPEQEGLAAALPFVLLQGLAKGDKLDEVLQHVVELGLTEFVPVACARSVVVLDEKKAARRRERWTRIAIEAARQCGRADVPRVAPVVGLREALADQASRDLRRLCAWEGEHSVGLRARLEGTAGGHALLVGPEGGLTQEEVALAGENGFEPVHLGRRILRTETAALAVLAAVRFQQGELG